VVVGQVAQTLLMALMAIPEDLVAEMVEEEEEKEITEVMAAYLAVQEEVVLVGTAGLAIVVVVGAVEK
jgi:hypothetical protein